MGFQAAAAARFAVYLLADMPIGTDFGLLKSHKVTNLQCETADAVDDVVAQLDGGGAVYVQAKAGASLSGDPGSPLGKTLGQLVHLDAQIGVTLNPGGTRLSWPSPRTLPGPWTPWRTRFGGSTPAGRGRTSKVTYRPRRATPWRSSRLCWPPPGRQAVPPPVTRT